MAWTNAEGIISQSYIYYMFLLYLSAAALLYSPQKKGLD